jgi:radical SAM-linked protein
LPLAYSQGFHPQPKISLAAALPLGFSSRAEVMGLRLNEEFQESEIKERLRKNLPGGIQVLEVETVDDHAPSLQTQIVSAEYEVRLTEPVETSALRLGIEKIMSEASLPRERRGKPYDLRPLIEELKIIESGNLLPHMQEHTVAGTQAPAIHLFMRLAAREGATGRPEEVLDALGISAETARVERTRLIFQG